jgi:uncharacterized protein (TIGR00251 family)
VVSVRLTPRAAHDVIVGWKDGVLQARVKAPPVEGKANEALCRMVAAKLGIASGRVAVVSGQTGRSKRVRIEGVDAGTVAARLEGG